MRGYKVIKLAALLAVFFVIMSLGSAMAVSKDEKTIVKELITKRTDTLSLFYASKLNYRDTVETIRAIEGRSLMESDIDNLKAYFRTDIEEIKKYNIQSVHIREADDEIICADVTILWYINGLCEEEQLSQHYSVICENIGGKFKLVQFL